MWEVRTLRVCYVSPIVTSTEIWINCDTGLSLWLQSHRRIVYRKWVFVTSEPVSATASEACGRQQVC